MHGGMVTAAAFLSYPRKRVSIFTKYILLPYVFNGSVDSRFRGNDKDGLAMKSRDERQTTKLARLRLRLFLKKGN
jgi:hypothetical protein